MVYCDTHTSGNLYIIQIKNIFNQSHEAPEIVSSILKGKEEGGEGGGKELQANGPEYEKINADHEQSLKENPFSFMIHGK